MRNLCLSISVVLIALHIYGISFTFGLSPDSELYTRFTYIFVHGGWTHLLINLYAFLSLVFLCNVKYWQFAASLVIAFCVPVFGDIPMVGFSTTIYAMTGIVIMESKNWWWLAIINLLFIGAGIVMPGIAFLAHLVCFAEGSVIGFLTSKIHGREIT